MRARPEEQNLRRLVQTLGIAARVEFPGFVDDAGSGIVRHARAVFYAPVDEDYGFVTVEALMAARPVITTDDAGGVLEFIENGNNGWVTRSDPKEIAAALSRVFEDAAPCRALGERGAAGA